MFVHLRKQDLQKMGLGGIRKSLVRTAIAASVTVLFIAVTIAHACIGTAASHRAHDHSGFAVGGLQQTSHTDPQGENCRSVRDRLLSLVPQSPQTHSLLGALHTIPVIGEGLVTELQALTAERPPGTNRIADDQPPLYIFNSVLRI
jgi:hypothetical protein